MHHPERSPNNARVRFACSTIRKTLPLLYPPSSHDPTIRPGSRNDPGRMDGSSTANKEGHRQFDIVYESPDWIAPDLYPQVAFPGWHCDWTQGGITRGPEVKIVPG
jgi:hypothetical protein